MCVFNDTLSVECPPTRNLLAPAVMKGNVTGITHKGDPTRNICAINFSMSFCDAMTAIPLSHIGYCTAIEHTLLLADVTAFEIKIMWDL